MDLKAEASKAFVTYCLIPLFTVLVGFVSWGIKKLSAKWDAEADNSKLSAVVSKFTHFADVVVHEVEAGIKADLEEASKDGVLTPEELTKIKDDAVAKLKAVAGSNGLQELESMLGIGAGGITSYLGGLIERAVKRLDKEAPSASAPVATGVASPLASGPGGLPPSR